jgi:tight adherence protein B
VNPFAACVLGLSALFAAGGVVRTSRGAVLVRIEERGAARSDRSVIRWRVRDWVAPLAGAAGGAVLAGAIGAALGMAIGFAVKRLGPRRSRAKLAALRDEQLADAVGAVASAMRSGLSLTQSIAYAADEAEPPMREHLEAIVHAVDVGAGLEDAVDAFATSVGTDEARLVSSALGMHRRTGGDLPVVLDQVAATVHDRLAVAREVRALTAQARLSGLILGLLPIGFFGFLWLTSRRDIESALTTPAGIGSVIVGLTLEVAAFLWIRHLLEVR